MSFRREEPGEKEHVQKKQKSSELAFAAPWLVPSPEYFAKIKL
jgi:hypothetical protein